MPNVSSFGFQSTRNFVPVTATATGPASKRQRALRVPRCAIATSARPDSISTRAPFDSVDRTRSRLPLSRTMELPSEKRSAVDRVHSPPPRRRYAPARRRRQPARHPRSWNEMEAVTRAARLRQRQSPPRRRRCPAAPATTTCHARGSPARSASRSLSTKRIRSARSSSAAFPSSSSALRIFFPALISFASARLHLVPSSSHCSSNGRSLTSAGTSSRRAKDAA